MKNKLNIIAIITAFVVGIGFNNFAMSNVPSKIAVVDVNKVVGQSPSVMALRKEQNLKIEELQKWIKTAQADVTKQSTEEGKIKLAKKYDEELAKKQNAMQKTYTEKLQVIDKSISKVIADEAKAKGYDIVLAKGVVLYGGDDITNTVAKIIK